MLMRISLLLILVFTASCAGKKVRPVDPESQEELNLLLETACKVGQSVNNVSGTVWIRAKSAELNGQFPAHILVKDENTLDMEVTNLIGATEAIVKIRDGQYEIVVPGKETESGKKSSWGGIPMKWANELFLGRVPCPKASAEEELRLYWAKKSDKGAEGLEVLVVVGKSPKEKFVYQFSEEAGKPWPNALSWENLEDDFSKVEFEFKKPEKHTRSPLKWVAKSSLGQVKVRWKDRDIKRQK